MVLVKDLLYLGLLKYIQFNKYDVSLHGTCMYNLITRSSFLRFCLKYFRDKQPVHVVVDPLLSNVLRPHQREVGICEPVHDFGTDFMFSHTQRRREHSDSMVECLT